MARLLQRDLRPVYVFENREQESDYVGTETVPVYVSFFKAWGRLPDEIGRQKPENLFFILLQSGGDEPTEINPAVRDLYGM